jgi:ATP-binding cassette subfamily B protein
MIPEGSGHLVLPVVSLIALFFLDFRVALGSLLSLPIGFVFMLITFAISGKSLTKYMESNARLNSVIVEYIEGIEVIRAFGKAGSSYKKYADAVLEYKGFVIDWMRSTWVSMKLAFAFMPATLLGVVPVSLFLVSCGSLSVSEMTLAVMLAMSMIVSFAKLEAFANSIRQMKYTVDQTEAFLNMARLSEPESKAILEGMDVRLKNVRFSYSEKNGEILHGIDLTLPQGSYTALVGPSGGGKSTLARLIARFWDVCDGSIEIGGVDIRNISIGQLSDLVSFVTQDNFLFQASIKENIRIGNPSATDEEVISAAKKARCDAFISKLPDGYDTSAGEAGKKLSGGEKQRIAIARICEKCTDCYFG